MSLTSAGDQGAYRSHTIAALKLMTNPFQGSIPCWGASHAHNLPVRAHSHRAMSFSRWWSTWWSLAASRHMSWRSPLAALFRRDQLSAIFSSSRIPALACNDLECTSVLLRWARPHRTTIIVRCCGCGCIGGLGWPRSTVRDAILADA